MTALQVPYDGWTTDDLPDTDFHYELVDGALLVTPPPDLRHVAAANRLDRLLAPLLPPGWESATDPGVYFGVRNYREPDVVVFRTAAIATGRLTPGDVLLAVELMSASSVATDRVAKPAQYAAAGIPHFWRLEQHPTVLITYALSNGVYVETARFDDRVQIAEPLAVSFSLTSLLADS